MNVWDEILCCVEKRTSPQVYALWFKPTSFEEHDSQHREIYVRVPNKHFQEWLSENYREVLVQSLEDLGLNDYHVYFLSAHRPGKDEENGGARSNGHDETHFNPKYTFSSFVVGLCNQFAHAASLAVAEEPSKAYNPLFLYGGVGLGKTHLMHAIGHKIRQANPHLRLMYLSAERFMNELINAIRYEKTFEFRERYRSIDVLLLDDVQSLAGKERTQEEFFHTFNALYDAQKQIVISSDSQPREIPTLEERLHSRFEWGLIADIQPPDLETKMAILRKKAELEGVSLPDDVSLFIASNVKSSVRELEGSLVRLIAYGSLTGQEISLNLAHRALKNIVDKNNRILTVDEIQRVVADYHSVKIIDLKNRDNSKRVALPRQIAMYLCREILKASLPEIGRGFGNKHHTTVLHSIRKIEQLRETDPKINSTLNRLTDSLR